MTFPAPEYIITVTVSTQRNITKWIFFFYILVECLSTVHLGKSPQTDRQTDGVWIGRGAKGMMRGGAFQKQLGRWLGKPPVSQVYSQFILFSTSDNMCRGYYHQVHLIASNEMQPDDILVQCCLSSRVIAAFSPIKTLMGPVVLQPAVNQKRVLGGLARRPAWENWKVTTNPTDEALAVLQLQVQPGGKVKAASSSCLPPCDTWLFHGSSITPAWQLSVKPPRAEVQCDH